MTAVGEDRALRTGSKVIQLPRRCEHCSASKELEGAPAWRGMVGSFNEFGRMGGGSGRVTTAEGR
jgi:hypothetical protein